MSKYIIKPVVNLKKICSTAWIYSLHHVPVCKDCLRRYSSAFILDTKGEQRSLLGCCVYKCPSSDSQWVATYLYKV